MKEPKPLSGKRGGGCAPPTLLGIGRVYPRDSMFLRTQVGEAVSGERKYEMATTTNGAPIIASKQTGKWFTLSWQDILTLAEQAGIDA